MNIWNIYCPGPSLNNAHPDPCNADIAVNQAILKYPNVEHWAIQDYDVFAKCSRILWTPDDPRPALWIPSSWITHEQNWIKKYKKGAPSIMGFPHICYMKTMLKDLMPFGKQIPWDEYTFFTAIALAILRGAQRIQVYGADMHGDGYYKDVPANDIRNHSEKRWDREREIFKEIFQISWFNKIYIERVNDEV